MLHYLVTSQDYQNFMLAQKKLNQFADAEDISAICGKQPHPFNSWFTKSVLKIVKIELFTFLLALTLVTTVALSFNLSLGIFFLMLVVGFLFSVWVSGLAGFELLQHYLQCQDVTQDKESMLALYVEVGESQENQLTSDIAEIENINVIKID